MISIRETAIRRLVEIASDDPVRQAAARPVLIQALGDPNQAVRALAFKRLPSLGIDNDARAFAAIESGHVEATGLARAGQRLVLRAFYDRPVRGGHRMTGVAEADGETVGRVEVAMSAHRAESEIGGLEADDQALDDYEIVDDDGALAIAGDERALAC